MPPTNSTPRLRPRPISTSQTNPVDSWTCRSTEADVKSFDKVLVLKARKRPLGRRKLRVYVYAHTLEGGLEGVRLLLYYFTYYDLGHLAIRCAGPSGRQYQYLVIRRAR